MRATAVVVLIMLVSTAAAQPPLALDALAGAPPDALVLTLGTPLTLAGPVARSAPDLGRASTAQEAIAVDEVLAVEEAIYRVAPGATLRVGYCSGRAANFELSLSDGLPTAAALLARAGLRPGQLEVVGSGPGYTEWLPRDRTGHSLRGRSEGHQGGHSHDEQAERPLIARVQASHGQRVIPEATTGELTTETAGWSRLVVDYAGACGADPSRR